MGTIIEFHQVADAEDVGAEVGQQGAGRGASGM